MNFCALTDPKSGTPIAYCEVKETDYSQSYGTCGHKIKLHCITCMKEYKGKSFEELRLEDYMLNRKGKNYGGERNSTRPANSPGSSSAFGMSNTQQNPTGQGDQTSGQFGSGISNQFGNLSNPNPPNTVFPTLSLTAPTGANTVFNNPNAGLFNQNPPSNQQGGTSPNNPLFSIGQNQNCSTPNQNNGVNSPFQFNTSTPQLPAFNFSSASQTQAPNFLNAASPLTAPNSNGNSFPSNPNPAASVSNAASNSFQSNPSQGFTPTFPTPPNPFQANPNPGFVSNASQGNFTNSVQWNPNQGPTHPNPFQGNTNQQAFQGNQFATTPAPNSFQCNLQASAFPASSGQWGQSQPQTQYFPNAAAFAPTINNPYVFSTSSFMIPGSPDCSPQWLSCTPYPELPPPQCDLRTFETYVKKAAEELFAHHRNLPIPPSTLQPPVRSYQINNSTITNDLPTFGTGGFGLDLNQNRMRNLNFSDRTHGQTQPHNQTSSDNPFADVRFAPQPTSNPQPLTNTNANSGFLFQNPNENSWKKLNLDNYFPKDKK